MMSAAETQVVFDSLRTAFDGMKKPERIFGSVPVAPAASFAAFAFFENIDWSEVEPTALHDLGDTVTVLTPEGYGYLAPRIMDFVRKYGSNAIALDVIDTFFMLPFLDGFAEKMKFLSFEQRQALWSAYDLITTEYESDGFPSWNYQRAIALENILGQQSS